MSETLVELLREEARYVGSGAAELMLEAAAQLELRGGDDPLRRWALGLSPRTRRTLRERNLLDPAVLATMSKEEILAIEGLGPRALVAIRDAIVLHRMNAQDY